MSRVVVLIDRAGRSRQIEIQSGGGPLESDGQFDPLQIVATVVLFKDSGLRDDLERPILTPDGGDVPLHLFGRQVFRIGKRLAVDVVVSTLELAHSRRDVEDICWRLAKPQFADTIVYLGTFEKMERATDKTRTYAVNVEERLPVVR
jgi:hypothetical protein